MRYRVDVRFNKDFVKVEKTSIVVGIESKPVDGKANYELVRKLAHHFRVPSSNISIISGMRSRKKLIEIIKA